MNTTENNKMIAEFMGWEYLNDSRQFKVPMDFIANENTLKEWAETLHENEIGYYLLSTSDLMFSTDWNWLMPVVEKIEKSGRTTVVFEQDNLIIITHLLHEIGEKYKCKQFSYASENKIEAVYTAVIEFIKWYNLNK